MKNVVLWLVILVCTVECALAGGRAFTNIVEPLEDVVIPTSHSINLRGQFFTGFQVRGKEDWIAAADVDAMWSISDGREVSGLEPAPIFFDVPGVYSIVLDLSVDGRAAQDTRTVTVVDMDKTFLDPPMGHEDGVTWIAPGVYSPVTLNSNVPARFLAFSVTHSDYLYRFWASPDPSHLGMLLRHVGGDSVDTMASRLLQEPNSLQVTGLPPGDYVLGLFLTSPQSSESFELHVEAKTPNRYVTAIASNAEVETGISVAYFGTEKACAVDYAAYDAAGVEVDRQTHLLQGGQSKKFLVGDIFLQADQISWIQINAGYHILAHAHVFNRQGQWSHGSAGQLLPNKNLYVAELSSGDRSLDSFYALTNISDQDILVNLQTTQKGYNLDGFLEGKNLELGAFTDLYQGDIPDTDDWGVFVSNTSAPQLLGTQFFHLSEGGPGTAAIELVNPQADAIFGSRYLFFPYVHSDPNTGSWTDFVVVNLEDIYSSFHAIMYNEWGQIVGQRTQTIDRLEKQRYSVADFAGGFVDDPSVVAWIEIHGASDITGYALFGTQNSKSSHVAGLPGGSFGVTQIWHMLVPSQEAPWTKAAFINLADETNYVTIVGLDASGLTVLEHDFVINPKKRLWGTAEEIFNALHASPDDYQHIAVIRMDAALPIMGFQLSGDQAGNHLAGFMAVH